MEWFGIDGWEECIISDRSGNEFCCWINRQFKGARYNLSRNFVMSNIDEAYLNNYALFCGRTRDHVIDEKNSDRLGRPVLKFGEQTYVEVWLVEEFSIDKMITILYYFEYLGSSVNVNIERNQGMKLVIDFIKRLSYINPFSLRSISTGCLVMSIMSDIKLNEFREWYIESRKISEILFRQINDPLMFYRPTEGLKTYYQDKKCIEISPY